MKLISSILLPILCSCSVAYHGFSRSTPTPRAGASAAEVRCKGSFTPVVLDAVGLGTTLATATVVGGFNVFSDILDNGNRTTITLITGGVLAAGYLASALYGLDRSGDCNDLRDAAKRREQAPAVTPAATTPATEPAAPATPAPEQPPPATAPAAPVAPAAPAAP